MLSRLPNSTLADLQKGDAVMIVCPPTAPIRCGNRDHAAGRASKKPSMTAAPNRSASSLAFAVVR